MEKPRINAKRVEEFQLMLHRQRKRREMTRNNPGKERKPC